MARGQLGQDLPNFAYAIRNLLDPHPPQGILQHVDAGADGFP